MAYLTVFQLIVLFFYSLLSNLHQTAGKVMDQLVNRGERLAANKSNSK